MEIQLAGKPYEIRETIGAVADAGKHTTQQVHVSGGGGFTHDGTGRSAPVSVTSVSTVHDTIFLVDEHGQESSLRLWGVDISVRPGHVLHTIWVRRKGQQDWTLAGIHNRSTGDDVWLGANFNKLFRLTDPLWKGILISLVIGIAAMMLCGVLLPMLPMVIALLLSPFAMALPILLPGLTWWFDRKGRVAVAALKALGAERFRAADAAARAPTG